MSKRKAAAKTKHTKLDENDNIKASPNAVQEIQRLEVLLEAEQEKGRIREDMIAVLKNDKAYLQGELIKKDELIKELLAKKDGAGSSISTIQSEKAVKCRQRGRPLKTSRTRVEDEETEDFSESVLSDSSEGSSMDRYKKKRSTTSPQPHSSSSSSRRPLKPTVKTEDLTTRSRARNTKGIILRYKRALDAFNRGGSMKAAFDLVHADRNTVARSAPIAELSLAAPEVFKSLGSWDERKEKMSSFVARCRDAMTPEIKAEISRMKADGLLLPIVSFPV